jgi:hypothetical protein
MSRSALCTTSVDHRDRLTLSSIPLHRVLRGDGTELGLDDVGAGSDTEGTGIGSNTPELLAAGDKLGVEASAGGGLSGGGTSSGGGRLSGGDRRLGGGSGAGEALGVVLVADRAGEDVNMGTRLGFDREETYQTEPASQTVEPE